MCRVFKTSASEIKYNYIESGYCVVYAAQRIEILYKNRQHDVFAETLSQLIFVRTISSGNPDPMKIVHTEVWITLRVKTDK